MGYKQFSDNKALRPVVLLFVFLISNFAGRVIHAACGATTRTWTSGAGTRAWATANNWSAANAPDTNTENAIILSATRNPQISANTTVSCVDVQSGQLTSNAAVTLSIAGDYFRSLTLTGVAITSTGFNINMAGTGTQTFENLDQIPRLQISNNTSVTFTQPFIIDTNFSITGTTSTVYIDADLVLLNGIAALTIPTGTTVQIRSGATLTSNTNITVNGSLILDSGTTLVMGNGRTLSVGATGNLQLNGADGSAAKITGSGTGSTFAFNVAGLMSANYFRIDRLTTAGLNITGTVQSMNNGEFHYLASAGRGLTLGAAASIPTTMSGLSFYDDLGYGNVKNILATAYTGAITTLNNWSGGIGGATYETDPNNKLTWGTQDSTKIVLSNSTALGSPAATIVQNSADTLFATYAFSLSQSSAITDITSIKVTMTGTGNASDIKHVKLYKDTAGGTACAYNAGVDTQIGSTLSLTGNPATTTFSIPAATIQTNGPTNLVCVHLIAATTTTAEDNQTLKFSISNTQDVVNSQGYSFSSTSGPPVSGGTSTITGDALRVWQGDSSTAFNTNANWTGNAIPTTGTDCRIGVGTNITLLNIAAATCQNTTLQSGGTLNFNSTTNQLSAYAKLLVQSGFNFTNATSGVLAMRGANNQILDMSTNFPGNMNIANTGAAPNNIVTVQSSTTIGGSLTVTSGVLSIANGVTLSVTGNITVQTGAILEILPGGTLALGNGSVLTVNNGAILKTIGTNSLTSRITSTGSAVAYTVVINGEIQAEYYTYDHLGTAGFSIESTATINATYALQNGNFNYPVNGNSTMLKLKRQVPGNSISNLTFSLNGSAATNVKNIDTTGASSGTLNITSYSGDIAGPTFDVDPTYNINWTGATNTLTILRDQSGPASVDAGSSYVMGRFGFTQTLPGASYINANLTSLKITLTGTGTSGDITALRIYKDTDCDSLNGTLIGSGTFAGSPASKTFTIAPGDFVIAADIATPPKNCIYVEYDVSNAATNAKTIGASIAASSDQINNQNYTSSGSISFPVTLGTEATINGAANTTWIGTTNTSWGTATNWTSGVPSSTKNCTINNVTNDPVINGITASCKSVTIGDGILTFTNGTSARLDVYGSYSSSGTVTQNDGIIRIIDAGAGLSQSIASTSTVTNLEIEKTGGGTALVSGTTLTVNSLTLKVGNTGTLSIPNSKILVLPNGISIPNGVLDIGGGGILKIGNGSTIVLNGGTFKTSGTHDQYPQNLVTKGKITVNGAGSWGFTATSGTLSLVGFVIDYINQNGLNVGGSTNFSNFRGGHFTNLSQNYSSVKVMQINTSTVPSPSDVEWYWGPNNTPPAAGDTYLLGSSTGCGGNTVSFMNWWGDFFDPNTSTPDTSTKISQTNCNIVISYANSPVSILNFTGVPYDGAVILHWLTGSETNHHGFNIYRSQSYTTGYVQINSDLIRNNFANLGPQGSYEFKDTTVSNGRLYYYIIEDVSTAGVKVKHGPVAAMPLGGLGSPPISGGNTNEDESDPDSDAGTNPNSGSILNPGLVDLGNGIHILSQTPDSLRIEIIVPPATYATSLWNPSYKIINVPGYSKTMTPGEPELAERIILIEVENQHSNVQATNESIIEYTPSGPHLVQPAPAWALDSNQILVPSHAPNSSTYSQNIYAPSNFYTLSPTTKFINNKTYIELIVRPLKYNASTQDIKSLQHAIIDIGLDGPAWADSTPPSSNNINLSPAAVSGTLRIRYEEIGMYEVTFEHLAELGIEGYYSDTNIQNLRGYYLGNEIPLHIISTDSEFNSGDKIRFWGDNQNNFESIESEVVISNKVIGNSTTSAPLRYADLSADPTNSPPTSMTFTEARASFEENNIFLNDRPMGDLSDHFYWARLGKWNSTQSSYYPNSKTFNLNLPGLIPNPNQRVRIKIDVRGRTQFAQNANYHFGLKLNSNPNHIADYTFSDYYPTTADFNLPAHNFVNGVNQVKLDVLADTVPTGDWELLDVNRFSVFYPSDLSAINGAKEIFKINTSEAIVLAGFQSENISVYEMSTSEDARVLKNTVISTPDSGTSYEVKFAISKVENSDFGYRLLAIDDTALLTPKSIHLNRGYTNSLKDTHQGADLIIIGEESFLDASENLILARRNEGLLVAAVTPNQIYDEFSSGIVSSTAIRDFLIYTYNNWAIHRPRYVLFIGEATTDPQNRLGHFEYAIPTPIPLLSGQFVDFGSDNWFVTVENEVLPKMAVGRIPAQNTIEVEAYVKKLLLYESGARAPSTVDSKSYGFYSDNDTLFEGFSQKAQNLSNLITVKNSQLSTWHKPLSYYSTPADYTNEIINDFNAPPLIMSYVGHGSEDLWGDQLLTNAHVSSLNNTALPIVIGHNCSTANYYDADISQKHIGEEFVMNQNGGAIAYWASTTYTVPETQVKLTQKFYSELASKTKGAYTTVRIGDLALAAKTSVSSQSSAKDAIRSWALIGDPSMKIPQSAFTGSSAPNSMSGKDDGGIGCGTVLPLSIDNPPPRSGASGIMVFLLMLSLPIFTYLKLNKRYLRRPI